MVRLDHTIRGWRNFFKSSKCPELFGQLDLEIDRRLSDFRAFYLAKISNRTAAQKRLATRVALLFERVDAAEMDTIAPAIRLLRTNVGIESSDSNC